LCSRAFGFVGVTVAGYGGRWARLRLAYRETGHDRGVSHQPISLAVWPTHRRDDVRGVVTLVGLWRLISGRARDLGG